MWLGALLLLVLVLVIFIGWDSRRLRSEKPERLSRANLAQGYRPGSVNKAVIYLGLSGMLAVLAFMEWMQPSLPPYTGRWSWFYGLIYELLGEQGLFIYWVFLAACSAAYGIYRLHIDKKSRPGVE